MTVTGIPADLYYSRDDAVPCQDRDAMENVELMAPQIQHWLFNINRRERIWDQNITIALLKDGSSKWNGHSQSSVRSQGRYRQI